MNRTEGLLFWVKMNMANIKSAMQSISGADESAQLLMRTFNIDISTVNNLAGGSSFLGSLVSFMNTTYAYALGCASAHSGCTDTEYQSNQFFNATLTKNIPFVSTSYDSISSFNETFASDPEIYSISKKVNVTFDTDIATLLFMQQ